MEIQDLANSLNGLRILILDDSKAFAMGLESIVKRLVKCEIDVFTNGEDALAYLGKTVPDIVVSDLEMAVMDGLEFIKRARALPSLDSTPMLILTGKENPETMIKCIAAGADAFNGKSSIQKQFIPQLLALARLRNSYKLQSAGRQLQAVKALIGTYKHEFGNALAIVDGKLSKFLREHPDMAGDASMNSVKQGLARFSETLRKLDNLRKIEEEKYSDQTNLLKTG